MDLDKVDAILTEVMDYDEKLMYYTHVAPRPFSEYVDKFPEGYFPEQGIARGLVYCDSCGYSHSDLVEWTHLTATEGYHGNGCFHEDSQLTQSNINTACYRSKLCGFNIFKLTSSANLNFDYHLFGEDQSAEYTHWAHEGVDINYTGTNERDVYAPISGDLVRLSSSTVLIYPTSGSYTVNVQHLDNAITDGPVTKGVTKIGDKGVGSGENHIHIGVCTDNGAECTTIHSGRDEEIILECVPPYTYID